MIVICYIDIKKYTYLCLTVKARKVLIWLRYNVLKL